MPINVRTPGDIINAIATLLQPVAGPRLHDLVPELANNSSVANTETGARMLRSMLAKRGVEAPAINAVVEHYVDERSKIEAAARCSKS